ncbi:MAG: FG-GAP repeat protein, partial [Solirubrobacteraceae bacterium]|nr:FG-GAP repeat protein [Solirubrobacteraceae bacterium]
MHTRTKLGVLGLVAAGAMALGPAAASAAPGAVDLPAQASIRLVSEYLDELGQGVTSLGDVNGDGVDDIAVFSWGGAIDPDPDAAHGGVWVLYGSRMPKVIDLGDPASVGDRGFYIRGAHPTAFAGRFGFGAAGDANGDGLADIAVVTSLQGLKAGRGYIDVVFGSRTTENVDLGALGDRGYRIEGALINPRWLDWGRAETVGDFDGDGRDDLLVATPEADGNAGAVSVVYGAASTETVSLDALGSRGVVYRGAAASQRLGRSVAPAGDVNADGRPDLLLGATGAAYVVLGSATPQSATVGGPGAGAVTITGDATNGEHVAAVGAVDGDGF